MQVSHQENGVAGIEAAHASAGNKRVSVVRCKVAEQSAFAEQPARVFQIGGHRFFQEQSSPIAQAAVRSQRAAMLQPRR